MESKHTSACKKRGRESNLPKVKGNNFLRPREFSWSNFACICAVYIINLPNKAIKIDLFNDIFKAECYMFPAKD